jgi:hypothetical protein
MNNRGVGAHALNGIPLSLFYLRQNRKSSIACAMRAKEGDAHASNSKYQKTNRPHGGILQGDRHLC